MNTKINPKQNFNVVLRWLQYSRNIKRQKYYSAKQLKMLFKSDIKIDISLINSMTDRAFTRHINSAADILPTFITCTHGYPSKTKYIMLQPDEIHKFYNNSLKISNTKSILPQN